MIKAKLKRAIISESRSVSQSVYQRHTSTSFLCGGKINGISALENYHKVERTNAEKVTEGKEN